MELTLSKPLYCLSKKYYAGGEVVIEFVTLDNRGNSAKIEAAFKTKEEAEFFELKKEYSVDFKPV
mgnify:FL=1